MSVKKIKKNTRRLPAALGRGPADGGFSLLPGVAATWPPPETRGLRAKGRHPPGRGSDSPVPLDPLWASERKGEKRSHHLTMLHKPEHRQWTVEIISSAMKLVCNVANPAMILRDSSADPLVWQPGSILGAASWGTDTQQCSSGTFTDQKPGATLEILHALCFLGICRCYPGVRELEAPKFTGHLQGPPGTWWGVPRLPSGCCKEYVTT